MPHQRTAPFTIRVTIPEDAMWGRGGGLLTLEADTPRAVCTNIERLAEVVPADATWEVIPCPPDDAPR